MVQKPPDPSQFNQYYMVNSANIDRQSLGRCEDVLSTPAGHTYYPPTTPTNYSNSVRGTTTTSGGSAPSYSRLVQLYATSTGTYDFARNLQLSAAHAGNPWMWIACFYFLGIIPLGIIVFGAVNLFNCPGEPMVPVHTIVNGAVLLLLDNLIIWERWPRPRRHLQHRAQSNGQLSTTATAMSHVNEQHSMRAGVILRRLLGATLKAFILVWAIAGVVWIYASRRYIDLDGAQESNNYCSPALYWVAFIFLTFELACVLLFGVIVAVFLIILAFTRGTQPRENDFNGEL